VPDEEELQHEHLQFVEGEFPSFDEKESTEVEAELPDDSYDADVADPEAEH
jgi:hypothetical protein